MVIRQSFQFCKDRSNWSNCPDNWVANTMLEVQQRMGTVSHVSRSSSSSWRRRVWAPWAGAGTGAAWRRRGWAAGPAACWSRGWSSPAASCSRPSSTCSQCHSWKQHGANVCFKTLFSRYLGKAKQHKAKAVHFPHYHKSFRNYLF